MRSLLSRIRATFQSRNPASLDDEVETHLELLAAEYKRNGMSDQTARAAARRAFGGVEQMKEVYRDRQRLPHVDELQRDIRHAWRSLMHAPGFTCACTAILTLGIGLNLALFQLVNVTSIQPLPLKDPDTLVRFFRLSPGGTSNMVPYRLAAFVGGNQQVLTSVLTQTLTDVAWQRDAGDRLRAAYVSANWFSELGYLAAPGRLFQPGDERADAEPAVILSHAFWQTRLGADPAVVGSIVHINEQPATVIGIAPERFPGLRLRDIQVWIPAAQMAVFNPGSAFATEWRNNTEMYGRLAPGVSAASARDALRGVMRALARANPKEVAANEWLEPYSARVRFEPPRDRRQRLTMAVLAGGLTLLVLLIACANLGSLVLSRAGERLREISIRTALGASRWRVMRQLLTESLVLATLGAAGGLVAGAWIADLLRATAALPAFLDFSPDWRMLLATLVVAMVAMVTMGLFPAWKISREGVATSIKDGGQQASSSLARTRFRHLLIGTQVAATCLLLMVAGAMLRNLHRALLSDPGFDFAQAAVLDASISRYGITGPAARTFWADVRAAVAALPECDGVAFASLAPLGSNDVRSVYPASRSLQVTRMSVDPEFFGIMRIPILAGRNFVRGDDPAGVVIVSRRLAEAMYGSLHVIGEQFPRRVAGNPETLPNVPSRTIIGVARDARLVRVLADDGAEQYSPIPADGFDSIVLIARARTDAARLLPPLRAAARAVDGRVLAEVRVMRADYATKTAPIRIGSSVTSALALVALVLACVGVFGIVAYNASLRMREFGIRLTLGASAGSVIRALLAQLVWPTIVGLLLGAIAAPPVVTVLRRDPFFLPSFDPSVHAAVLLVLIVTVAIAGVAPALRMLRANPITSLRCE